MCKPSREMPPTASRPMPWTGVQILSLFESGPVALVCCVPAFLAPISAVLLATGVLTFGEGRRLARMAADRQGESICSFARSFDSRVVDTWVIRAIFEELQPYCSFGRGTLPVRPTDDLDGDLRIAPEDLEDSAVGIAYRTERALGHGVKSPHYGNVEPISYLVMLFANPPRRTA